MGTPAAAERSVLTLTAIVCTRNRASWSARAVRSLLDQAIDRDRLEVLVVDNASTDDTATVLRRVVADAANARYVHEPLTGLSRARNRGVAEASGQVIAFLDDDAIAAPGWAAAHLRTYELDGDVVGTGGPIELVWPEGRPEWLHPRWDGMYAGLRLGDHEHEFEPPGIPYGANMAFRRSAVVDDDAFEVGLGRQGEDLTSGEEREFFDRLRRAGGRLVYVPTAPVAHHVLPDRLGRRWFLRRVYAQGRSHVLIDRIVRPGRGTPYWIGRSGYQALRAGGHGARWAGLRLTTRDARRTTDAVAAAAHAAGIAVESGRTVVDRARGRDDQSSKE